MVLGASQLWPKATPFWFCILSSVIFDQQVSAATVLADAPSEAEIESASFLARMGAPRMMRAERERQTSIEVNFVAELSHENTDYDKTYAMDCTLTEWSAWSQCPVTCGSSEKSRSRNISTAANAVGFDCIGIPQYNTTTCTMSPCALDCSWGSWGNWGTWSSTCQAGVRASHRNVTQYPTNGGIACNDTDAIMIQNFNTTSAAQCSIDCMWAPWSAWSTCSNLCGSGLQRAFRNVVTPAQYNGTECDSSFFKLKNCSGGTCSTDCNTSDWTNWSPCSASCGGTGFSHQTRSRTQPTNGGLACPTNFVDTKEQICNMGDCTNQCTYSTWSSWTSCTATCGWGNQYRQALLKPTAPNCSPTMEESAMCRLAECPVNCTYSNWSSWSSCSPSCGTNLTATQSQQRSIREFASWNGYCSNLTSQTTNCSVPQCPIDCRWSNWTDWTVCSTSAACAGITDSIKTRTILPSQYGGSNSTCDGKSNQSQKCICPENCEWQDWSAWGECSVTCAGGTKTATRAISSHGKLCPGNTTTNTNCNTQACAR